jgi:6-phosphogluconolactonase
MKRKIEQVPDFEELIRIAAQKIVRVAQEAIDDRGQMAFALAGGSTPKKLYTLLASKAFRSQIPWDTIHFFWGDERHVPPDHQDSNYLMARETLLAHVPVPEDHVHPIPSELQNAEEAADHYERELREYFQLPQGGKPRFDLILLGMGPDGHTASLFPGTSAVHETTRLVTAPWVEKFANFRITLTPAVLNEAAHVMFLVSGHDKAETLRSVLEGPYQPDLFPSQVINPAQGQLLWLVDKEAAGCLRSPLTV